jgi:hypothetical protein
MEAVAGAPVFRFARFLFHFELLYVSTPLERRNGSVTAV